MKENKNILENYQEFCSKGILPAGKSKNQMIGFALGLAGETGEVCDDIKKREYHGRDIPMSHTIEELGDVMWYVANLCSTIGVTIEDVIKLNKEKLLARYPQMYNEEKRNGR